MIEGMIDTKYKEVLRWLLLKQGYPPLPNPDDRKALSMYTREGCRKGRWDAYCYGITDVLVEPKRIYVIMRKKNNIEKHQLPKSLPDIRLTAARQSHIYIYRVVLIDDRGISLYRGSIDVDGNTVSIHNRKYKAVKSEKIMGVHVLHFDHSIYPYTVIDTEEAEVGNGYEIYEIFGLILERRQEDERSPFPWGIMEAARWDYTTWLLAQKRISLDRGVIEGCHSAEAVQRYLEAYGITVDVVKRGTRCVLFSVHSQKIAEAVNSAVEKIVKQLMNTRTNFTERFGSYIVEVQRAAPVRATIPIEVEFAPGVKRRYMYEYRTWPAFYVDEKSELIIRGHEGTVKIRFREPGMYAIDRSPRERAPIYNIFAIKRALKKY